MNSLRYRRVISGGITAFVLAFLLGVPVTARANIEEIVLRVDGLACPFCAYGLEKKLQRVSGVDRVDVQMDAGRVVLEPSPGAIVSTDNLERAVSDAGFSLRGTDLTATGHLGERGGAMILRLDGSPAAVLELVGDVIPEEFERRVGEALVRVSGRLERSRLETDRIVFVVRVSRYERVEPA